MSREDSNIILRAQDLILYFVSQHYRFLTVRDFIGAMAKDPLGAISNQGEQVKVLNNISFEVRQGDRIGLIGPNGVGKTSLCRCLAELYVPNSGRIENYGHKIRAIFDTTMGIQPELTGRENAALLLNFMYPELTLQHRQMLQEICDFSDLGEDLDRPYKFYSNGMQARLALSLISARPADLLILDEVFDGADQFFRKKISARVTKMIDESGAVIFVSHSPDQILQVCNRVWLLQNGQIVFDGNPEEAIKIYSETSDPRQT